MGNIEDNVSVRKAGRTTSDRKAGRPKKYNTDEERHEADKADKRRYYHKNKENRRDHYRLRSLKTYYLNKLKKSEENGDPDSVKFKIMCKIYELQKKIDNLGS